MVTGPGEVMLTPAAPVGFSCVALAIVTPLGPMVTVLLPMVSCITPRQVSITVLAPITIPTGVSCIVWYAPGVGTGGSKGGVGPFCNVSVGGTSDITIWLPVSVRIE